MYKCKHSVFRPVEGLSPTLIFSNKPPSLKSNLVAPKPRYLNSAGLGFSLVYLQSKRIIRDYQAPKRGGVCS